MKKLIITILLAVTVTVYGQKDLRKLLPGTWHLDSIYQDSKKVNLQYYIDKIEFTGNGRILLGRGIYNYTIIGDSVNFDFGMNDIYVLISITKENLVIEEKSFAEYPKDKYLYTQVNYYSKINKEDTNDGNK